MQSCGAILLQLLLKERIAILFLYQLAGWPIFQLMKIIGFFWFFFNFFPFWIPPSIALYDSST